MRPRDRSRAKLIEAALCRFHRKERALPGISHPLQRKTFVEQLLESLRRVNYVSVIKNRDITSRRADPADTLFDPLKAAIFHQRLRETEEAFWLVFLFVHFGLNARGGWRYAREVYGRLGDGAIWTWKRISTQPSTFRDWLAAHLGELKREGAVGGFGNHRKYQSLDPYSKNGTGAAVESYVEWVAPPRTHQELFNSACEEANDQPRTAFDILFRSMRVVASFGRTARFDYLAMVGKLALAPIEPGAAYLRQATGPLKGARLLFGGETSSPLPVAALESWLVQLESRLGVGMQALEDALCNWQKSPARFVPFRR